MHVMRIKKWDYYVGCLATPLVGRGGGQFANHSKRNANCIIRVIKTETKNPSWRYFNENHQFDRIVSKPVLVLVATTDIAGGQEVLWKYPRNTLARMGIDWDDESDLPERPNPTDADMVFQGYDDLPDREISARASFNNASEKEKQVEEARKGLYVNYDRN